MSSLQLIIAKINSPVAFLYLKPAVSAKLFCLVDLEIPTVDSRVAVLQVWLIDDNIKWLK